MLAFQLSDKHDRGVLSASLPLPRQEVTELIRGERDPRRPLPDAVLNDQGRLADLVGLGWAMAFAVSERFVSILSAARLTGWTARPLRIVGMDLPVTTYSVFCVTGRCGPVDYGRAQVVEPLGHFTRLRGLVTGAENWDGSDFCMPENRSSILVTDTAAEKIGAASLSSVRLTAVEEVEFDTKLAPEVGS
jgi:hypothetical protein